MVFFLLLFIIPYILSAPTRFVVVVYSVVVDVVVDVVVVVVVVVVEVVVVDVEVVVVVTVVVVYIVELVVVVVVGSAVVVVVCFVVVTFFVGLFHLLLFFQLEPKPGLALAPISPIGPKSEPSSDPYCS